MGYYSPSPPEKKNGGNKHFACAAIGLSPLTIQFPQGLPPKVHRLSKHSASRRLF
jgi:hypothetical protein